MRVERRSEKLPPAGKGASARRLERVEAADRESFSDLLREEAHSGLQSIIREIMELGDELANHRTHSTLRRYTEAVRRFMAHVVRLGYSVKAQDNLAGDVSRTVQVIDKALTDLAEVVLARESSRIDILSKLEYIQGLLVDCVR